MKEFSHIGIPTSEPKPQENYLEEAKLYVTDFNDSEHKIEWLRFEADSPLPELLKTTAHVAYMVDDLNAAMSGQEVLMEPFSPVEGLLVGFIISEGAPIELMQTV